MYVLLFLNLILYDKTCHDVALLQNSVKNDFRDIQKSEPIETLYVLKVEVMTNISSQKQSRLM